MRAIGTAETGVARSADGVRIAYEVFGLGEPTIVFLPSTPIVNSRQWKGQVPHFSRQYRVVAFDGRGNGRSDRPTEPDYREERLVIQGGNDAITDPAGGAEMAAALGARLVTLDGAGHGPAVPQPVHVNLLLREFVEDAMDTSPPP